VRFGRWLLALVVTLAIVGFLGTATFVWVDQLNARTRVAEAELQPALDRAAAAEDRAARAEASLTAIADRRVADASATATSVAQANEPEHALERILGQVFNVYQDPAGPGYDHLNAVLSPDALQVFRGEADYLRLNGRHLGGASTWSIDSSAPNQIAGDRAEVHTTEHWLYDERDDSDKRLRCFVEVSDQTYTLVLNGQAWTVDSIQLGSTSRTNCPPGS
jgi:hypothetical protein